MLGRWRGTSLATNHPLDGLLEKLGWYGKAFESPDRVHPLLFLDAAGDVTALDPALMPVALALHAPRVAHSRAVCLAFAAAQPLLRTRHSARPSGRSSFGVGAEQPWRTIGSPSSTTSGASTMSAPSD